MLKVQDSLWLVLTQRGTVYASGNDIKLTLKQAFEKHFELAVPVQTNMYEGLWETMKAKGYKCVKVNINQQFTDDQLVEVDKDVMTSFGQTQTYDP